MQLMDLDPRYQSMLLMYYFPINLIYYLLSFFIVVFIRKGFVDKYLSFFSTLPNIMAILVYGTFYAMIGMKSSNYAESLVSLLPHFTIIVLILILKKLGIDHSKFA